MSINRKASAVTENTADFITFNQTRTGGRIGNATSAQQNNGYSDPNVQAAIDDLWERVLIPPGSLYQSLSPIDPATVRTSSASQVSTITVSGTPAASGNITVLNIAVAVLAGDTAAQVATKIAAALNAQAYISSATASGAVVTYSYIDSNSYPVENSVQNGLTLTSKTTTLGGTPGYLGYGSWELMGSETKYTRTVYSWLRIA